MSAARLGPPQQELELAAGDLLYVPRGMVHQARALGEATVHLTFGLFFPTWHEVLEECLASASHQLVGLRRSLAACPRPEPEIEPLVAAFGERAVVEAFDRVRARFVQQLQPLPRALSASTAAERAPRIDDQIERVPGMIAHVSEDASGVRIAFPRISDADYAFELAQPAFMADALRFVGAARGPFAVRDIPGEIDDERRLRFVAQLLRAGLLQRAAGEAVSDDK